MLTVGREDFDGGQLGSDVVSITDDPNKRAIHSQVRVGGFTIDRKWFDPRNRSAARLPTRESELGRAATV